MVFIPIEALDTRTTSSVFAPINRASFSRTLTSLFWYVSWWKMSGLDSISKVSSLPASRTGLGVVPYDPESLKMSDEQWDLPWNRGCYTTIVKVNVLWVKRVKFEKGMSERRWGLLVEFTSTMTSNHSSISQKLRTSKGLDRDRGKSPTILCTKW